MSNEQIKEKYGIELIGKEMWVWDDDKLDAQFRLVLYKNNDKTHSYKCLFGFYANASETNPNEPKQPKVGDKGFFWNKEDGYVFSDLIYIDHDGSSIPYYCSLELWFRNFSHEKQPWMK
jgi:hypothetical protein